MVEEVLIAPGYRLAYPFRSVCDSWESRRHLLEKGSGPTCAHAEIHMIMILPATLDGRVTRRAYRKFSGVCGWKRQTGGYVEPSRTAMGQDGRPRR